MYDVLLPELLWIVSACQISDCGGCNDNITSCDWCMPGTGPVIQSNGQIICERKSRYNITANIYILIKTP